MPENFEAKFIKPAMEEKEEAPETPSVQPEDIPAGEEVVSQKETHIKKRPFWNEFRGDKTDKDRKYKEPTPEQRERFEKRIENLENYGFSEENITAMIMRTPSILKYTPEKTNKSFQNLENYGFSKENIIAMFTKAPYLLSYTPKRTNESLENLGKYGFLGGNIIDMVTEDTCLLIYTPERINKSLKNLEQYGFSRENIIVIAMKVPSLLSRTPERINKSLKNLEEHEFPRENIITMVTKAPSILIYTPNRINKSLKNLENQGFSNENIRIMTEKLPTLLCWRPERIGETIKWFHRHQIRVDLVKSPWNLMISLKTLEYRRSELEKNDFDYRQNPSPLFYTKKRWQDRVAKQLSNRVLSNTKEVPNESRF